MNDFFFAYNYRHGMCFHMRMSSSNNKTQMLAYSQGL